MESGNPWQERNRSTAAIGREPANRSLASQMNQSGPSSYDHPTPQGLAPQMKQGKKVAHSTPLKLGSVMKQK